MLLLGITLAAIGFATLILPSDGAEFFVMEAIAGVLGISAEMLSMLLAILGFALIVVRVALSIFRSIKSRAAVNKIGKDQP